MCIHKMERVVCPRCRRLLLLTMLHLTLFNANTKTNGAASVFCLAFTCRARHNCRIYQTNACDRRRKVCTTSTTPTSNRHIFRQEKRNKKKKKRIAVAAEVTEAIAMEWWTMLQLNCSRSFWLSCTHWSYSRAPLRLLHRHARWMGACMKYEECASFSTFYSHNDRYTNLIFFLAYRRSSSSSPWVSFAISIEMVGIFLVDVEVSPVVDVVVSYFNLYIHSPAMACMHLCVVNHVCTAERGNSHDFMCIAWLNFEEENKI